MDHESQKTAMERVLEIEQAIRLTKKLLGHMDGVQAQGVYEYGVAGEELRVGHCLEKGRSGAFYRWTGEGNPTAVSLGDIREGCYAFFQIKGSGMDYFDVTKQ